MTDTLSMLQPVESVVGPGAFRAGPKSYWAPTARFMTYKPADTIEIGDFCSISLDVRLIAGGNHNFGHIGQYPFSLLSPPPWEPEPQQVGTIRVGNDVWIGTGVLVIADATIGDGAVLGAGAVVTRDVGPYEIVVGAPARVVKKRFDDTTIERLLALRWWDWPVASILEAESLLRSGEIARLEEFAALHELPRKGE